MGNNLIEAMCAEDWHRAAREQVALMPELRRDENKPHYLFLVKRSYGILGVRFDFSSEVLNSYFEEQEKITVDFRADFDPAASDFWDLLPEVISSWLIGDTSLMQLATEGIKQCRFDNCGIDIQESITNAAIGYEMRLPGMSFEDSEATKTVLYIIEEE